MEWVYDVAFLLVAIIALIATRPFTRDRNPHATSAEWQRGYEQGKRDARKEDAQERIDAAEKERKEKALELEPQPEKLWRDEELV